MGEKGGDKAGQITGALNAMAEGAREGIDELAQRYADRIMGGEPIKGMEVPKVLQQKVSDLVLAAREKQTPKAPVVDKMPDPRDPNVVAGFSGKRGAEAIASIMNQHIIDAIPGAHAAPITPEE